MVFIATISIMIGTFGWINNKSYVIPFFLIGLFSSLIGLLFTTDNISKYVCPSHYKFIVYEAQED
jgi:hypothetical protein